MLERGTRGASTQSDRLADFARSARQGLAVTELARRFGVTRQRAHQILHERHGLHDAWRRRRQQLRQQRVDGRLAAWRRTEQGSILMRAARELHEMGFGTVTIEQPRNCPVHILVGGVRLRFVSPACSFLCGKSTRYFRIGLHLPEFYVVALADGRRCIFAPDERRMVYLPDDPAASFLPRSVPVVAWTVEPLAVATTRRQAARRAA